MKNDLIRCNSTNCHISALMLRVEAKVQDMAEAISPLYCLHYIYLKILRYQRGTLRVHLTNPRAYSSLPRRWLKSEKKYIRSSISLLNFSLSSWGICLVRLLCCQSTRIYCMKSQHSISFGRFLSYGAKKIFTSSWEVQVSKIQEMWCKKRQWIKIVLLHNTYGLRTSGDMWLLQQKSWESPCLFTTLEITLAEDSGLMHKKHPEKCKNAILEELHNDWGEISTQSIPEQRIIGWDSGKGRK